MQESNFPEHHKPVLLKEVLSFLPEKKGLVVVDATFGEGGHSQEILKKVNDLDGYLIAIDWDSEVRKNFDRLKEKERANFVKGNFKDILEILKKEEKEKVDFILADLGWRLEQIQEESYGLSFSSKSSLSMRLDGDVRGLTAEEVVNNRTVGELSRIFWTYGEEKQALLVARTIAKARKEQRIVSAKQLSEIVNQCLRKFYYRSKLHPATKVFQALRIFVNEELDNLSSFLQQALECLNRGGRLAVITFHSGEDRIVKNFFRANARGCICPSEFPKCVCGRKPGLRVLTAKPVLPSGREKKENFRCRSAKLRVAEKI